MDTLKTSPAPRAGDAIDRFLPPECGLAMAPCRLDRRTEKRRTPAPHRVTLLFRRLLILAGTAWLTIAGGYEMYGVVKVGGVTVLEGMLLALFFPLLAWVAFSFMSALVGFFVVLARQRGGLVIARDGDVPAAQELAPSISFSARRLLEQVRQVVGVLFFRSENPFEHAARRRIVVAQVLDHLPVALDRDPLGDEVLANHLLHGLAQTVFGVALSE